jgi:arabinan endo-1,5-alpha-L-arabinosidase
MVRSFLILIVALFSQGALAAHELVLDHDFPDPSLIKAKDGYYYAYATQGYTEGSSPLLMNFQVARSKDLKAWEHLGEALPVKPDWASKTQSFWAPHITFANDQYYLFYSADPNSRDGLCLAVATSKTPQGPFTDSGRPLQCGPSYSNIDPMLFPDPVSKQNLLYWGSAFTPIRVRPMTDDLLSFVPNTTPKELVAPDRGPNPAPYTKLYEGAWLLEHGDYKYLFVSGEDCCGQPDPHYAVLVLRSKSLFGPFEWRNQDPRQSVFIEKGGDYSATGHNAFITDDSGQLWTFYHGVSRSKPLLDTVIPGDRVNRRILLRSKVDFVDGWPVLR